MSIFNTVLKKISEEPIKYLNIFSLIVGGILFLIYFAEIKYFPEVNLSNIAHLIFAMFLFGVLTLIYLAMLLVLPSIMWSGIIKSYLDNKKLSETLKGHSINNLFIYMMIVANMLAIFILDTYHESNHEIYQCLLAVVIALTFVAPMVSKKLNKIINFPKDIWFFLITFAILLITSIFSWFVLFLVFINGDVPYWYGIIFGFFVIIVTNYIFSEEKYIGILIVVVTMIIIFILTKSYGMIPNAFMRLFHFGNFSATEIYLKKTSCDFVKNYDLNISYNPNASESAKLSYGCVIKHQKVLLRLGKDFVIKSNGKAILLHQEDIITHTWELDSKTPNKSS